MPDFVQIIKYGKKVWASSEIEKLRKTNCLCLNCIDMKECELAQKLYKICCEEDMALAVTRCPNFRVHTGIRFENSTIKRNITL